MKGIADLQECYNTHNQQLGLFNGKYAPRQKVWEKPPQLTCSVTTNARELLSEMEKS
jgi:hypothetical protein